MKQSVIVFVTGLLAIAVGVAIAGLPGGARGSDLVITERVTSAPDSPAIPVTTTQPTFATTTIVDRPEPTTTSVDRPEPTTTSSTTTPIATSTSTTAAGSATSSTAVPSTSIASGLLERAGLAVATANANGVSGIAGATAQRLIAVGYIDVSPVDALERVPTSVVYFEPGLQSEAARLAVDLGWDVTDIAPALEQPALQAARAFELVVMIGLDRS